MDFHSMRFSHVRVQSLAGNLTNFGYRFLNRSCLLVMRGLHKTLPTLSLSRNFMRRDVKSFFSLFSADSLFSAARSGEVVVAGDACRLCTFTEHRGIGEAIRLATCC